MDRPRWRLIDNGTFLTGQRISPRYPGRFPGSASIITATGTIQIDRSRRLGSLPKITGNFPRKFTHIEENTSYEEEFSRQRRPPGAVSPMRKSEDQYNNKKQRMKNRNNYLKIKIAVLVMAAMLCCLCPSMVRAGDGSEEEGAAIAGLWQNHFISSVGNPAYETYSQWHPDGLEIDTPNFLNAVCMGTFKAVGARTFKLFHVGWTPGGTPAAPTSVRFELRELNKISIDHNSFKGTYDQKYFDASGNLVFEDKGVIHSTRLTADMY